MKDKNMNVLLIVAAGKSSRFGGFPKAFCKVNGKMVIENSIEIASHFFDKIYVGVNKSIYNDYIDKIENCELFWIKTGQGDAHSLLKCLKYIKNQNESVTDVIFCWGDAYFVSGLPFSLLLDGRDKAEISVACSIDSNPYAWFDIEDDVIIKAHFAKEEGLVEKGIHDQCLFKGDMDFTIDYLNSYRLSLGIPEDNDENECDINEMKLLNSFEYLHNTYGIGAKYVMVEKNQVLTFNTQEELDSISQQLNQM